MPIVNNMATNRKTKLSKSALNQLSWSNARDDMLDTIPCQQIPNRDDRLAFIDMLDNSSTTSVATNDSARTSISASVYEDGSANFRKRRTKTYRGTFVPSLPSPRSKRMEGYSFDKEYEIVKDCPDGPIQWKSQATMHWDQYLAVKPLPGAKPRIHVHISQQKRRGQKERTVNAVAS